MKKPFYWKARKGWYYKVTKANGTRTNVRLDAKTEEQAYAIWMKMKERGQRFLADDACVTDIIELYVAAQETKVRNGQLAQSTFDRIVDQQLSRAIADPIGDIAIADLKPYHALEWLARESGWGATTQHHAANALKLAFNWAKAVGRLDSNPIESLKVEKGEGRTFLIDRKLYELLVSTALKDERGNVRSFARVLMALWHSGCRPSEIADVCIEHIREDQYGMTWVLPDHKNRRKKKQPRVIYLNACLRTLTLEAKGNRTSGPLFLANFGEGWDYNRLRLRFQRMRDRLGVNKKCVLYSFRHTSITRMLTREIGLATVAELHGTSIKMIQDHYGHLCQHAKFLHDAVHAASLPAQQRQQGEANPVKPKHSA